MEEVGGVARLGSDVVIPRRHVRIMMLAAELTRLIVIQNKTADRSEHVEKEVKRSVRKEASVIVISAILFQHYHHVVRFVV
jgi:hypothetical protein